MLDRGLLESALARPKASALGRVDLTLSGAEGRLREGGKIAVPQLAGGSRDCDTQRMRPAQQSVTASHIARLGGTASALGLFAVAMWFAWLGWDNEYYQVDGVAQGPYRTWQVVGCGLSIATAAVLTHLWVRGVWAIFVLSAAAVTGFAVPWALDASATDDSGLWVVGLLFLLVGGGLGLAVLLAIIGAVASRRPLRLGSDD